MSDVLYVAKAALFLIGLVLLMMTPFFYYLYWLNNKQNRYFKRLSSELNLDYKSTGNKIKRDFPQLNGQINDVTCFIGAARTKGRSGSSAQTRNHLPILMMQTRLGLKMDAFNLQVAGNEIKHFAKPTIKLKGETLKQLQAAASDYGTFNVQLKNSDVLEIILPNELSNEKQFEKVRTIFPLLVSLTSDITLLNQ